MCVSILLQVVSVRACVCVGVGLLRGVLHMFFYYVTSVCVCLFHLLRGLITSRESCAGSLH